MTEQIKDSMETCRIIVHAFEEELLNQCRYNDAKEIEVALNDMLKAFRSLNAWDEVLNELEELKQDFKNDRNFREASAVNISIKRIKQKLSEIERK